MNDFVEGIRILLAKGGVCTIEFPSLFNLIDLNQFDTIYHEHFSYFSFTSATRVFEAHDLVVWDVEELPTHGGSLRMFAPACRGPVETTYRTGLRRCWHPSRGGESTR